MMKAKLIKLAGAVVLLAVAAVLVVRAAPALLTGGFTTVNNATNDSVSMVVGSFAYPRGTFVFANNGLTATNALTNLTQLSLDSSNWVTVGVYSPSRTNATNEPYLLPFTAQTVYMRVRTVTTNSVQAAVLYQQ